MKIIRFVCASFAALLAACLLHAADNKPGPAVMSLVDIETKDPSGYATRLAKFNEIAKTKLGTYPYLRVYESIFDGLGTGRVRVAAYASSVVEMTKNMKMLESDLTALQRNELDAIRKQGGRVLYQSVRRDGTIPNASLYFTLATVSDEAGYLKALDQLRGILDSNGLKDVYIIVWRVIAGCTDHTHRIVITTPSPERLAAVLDLVAANKQVGDWVAASAKYRTVVSNGTAREITK